LKRQQLDPFSPAAALRHRNQKDSHDNILSSSGARWATFLALGIAPIIVFGIVVNSTPHLRMQLIETIDSVQSYYAPGSPPATPTKPEEQMEYNKKSDT
jgi:hypothetical protein